MVIVALLPECVWDAIFHPLSRHLLQNCKDKGTVAQELNWSQLTPCNVKFCKVCLCPVKMLCTVQGIKVKDSDRQRSSPNKPLCCVTGLSNENAPALAAVAVLQAVRRAWLVDISSLCTVNFSHRASASSMTSDGIFPSSDSNFCFTVWICNGYF